MQENLAYASLDTIQQLADSLGVAVKDLFDPSSYDAALGGYKLNMAALTANGLNNITNKSNIVPIIRVPNKPIAIPFVVVIRLSLNQVKNFFIAK